MLLSFGYRHRSRLDVHERDWAITPFYAAAAGGYSSNSNPGNYFQNLANSTQAAAAYAFRDNGCAALGGTLTRVQSLNNTSTGATSTKGANSSCDHSGWSIGARATVGAT